MTLPGKPDLEVSKPLLQRQRRSTPKPRVARLCERTLGSWLIMHSQPHRGCTRKPRRGVLGYNPVGVDRSRRLYPGCASICSRPWALGLNAVGVEVDPVIGSIGWTTPIISHVRLERLDVGVAALKLRTLGISRRNSTRVPLHRKWNRSAASPHQTAPHHPDPLPEAGARENESRYRVRNQLSGRSLPNTRLFRGIVPRIRSSVRASIRCHSACWHGSSPVTARRT